MALASVAVRSRQIWRILAMVEEQMEYIKVLKLCPEITILDLV